MRAGRRIILTMTSLQGKLLIALPDLADGNFFRTVILVINHDPLGASGVVLNRPSDLCVIDVADNLKLSQEPDPSSLSLPIFIGGPVDGPLVVLHDDVGLAQETVLEGVYMATRRDLLESLFNRTGRQLRVFNRYSGWAPGQLDGEVQSGGWLILDARQDLVFCDPEKLWKNACREFSGDVHGAKGSGSRDVGDVDPGLN